MNTPNVPKSHDNVSDGRRVTSPVLVAPADHDLTVIIPAYNEENRLPWTLAQLGAWLNAWGVDYRVMVADDGSTDRTASLARELGPRSSSRRSVWSRKAARAGRCERPCSGPLVASWRLRMRTCRSS